MKNKKLKALVVCIAACLFAVALLGGCSSKVEIDETEVFDGIAMPETNTYFVYEGKTDYKIVVPAQMSGDLSFAVNELTDFLRQATGIGFTVQTDEQNVLSKGKYLFVGDTKMTREAGVAAPADLGDSGYVVKHEDDNVYMLGTNDSSTLYAVYQFLENMFDFEVFAENEIYIEQKSTVKMQDFDIAYKPSFEYRTPFFNSVVKSNPKAMKQLRIKYDWIGGQPGSYHTSYLFVPHETYYKDHNDWFSNSNADASQLCYSNTEWWDIAVENVIDFILKNKTGTNLMFGQQDSLLWCRCEQCTADSERYGSDSASYVKFINYLGQKVEEFFASDAAGDQKGREVIIVMSAYHMTETPPTKNLDEIRMRPNTGVRFTPINAFYNKSFYDVENRSVYENMKGWNNICDHMYAWTYCENFRTPFVPFNNFNTLQDNYKAMAECGITDIFEQGVSFGRYSAGFHDFRIYLQSKWSWNVNYDFNTMKNEFFRNYYGPASEPMLRYFDELRAHFADLEENQNFPGGDIFSDTALIQYWPKALLDDWNGYIDEAYQSIESLRESDPQRYDDLYERITRESITIRYLLISHYSTAYSSEHLLQMKNDFRNDVEKYEIGTSESVTADSIWTSWGIA